MLRVGENSSVCSGCRCVSDFACSAELGRNRLSIPDFTKELLGWVDHCRALRPSVIAPLVIVPVAPVVPVVRPIIPIIPIGPVVPLGEFFTRTFIISGGRCAVDFVL